MSAAYVDPTPGTLDAAQKTWCTLVARAAMRGYQLWRSDAADGPQRYFLGRWNQVPAQPDKQMSLKAQMALHPNSNAAAVMLEYGKPFGEQDTEALMTSLRDAMNGMLGGDMQRAETMLFAQAHALQAIFMNFSRRALTQEYQSHLESFLHMALKAQHQCRVTLETLATIKNPPVVFARQANINNGGQQQVNNGTAPQPNTAPLREAKPAAAQNELLEASDGERLDTGAAGATSGADPHLETVAAVHRPPYG